MEKPPIDHHVGLTSAELGYLWTCYVGDSMSKCILKYFLKKVEDSEIQPILEHALDLSQQHCEKVTKIFVDEGIAVPQGFSDKDVNYEAPRLWSDEFFLNYVKHMAKGGLGMYAYILPSTVRKDTRNHFSKCLSSTTELYNETTNVLLSKGIEVRPPFIPYPKKVDFVHKQSFLSGWFGEQRPLTSIEIAHLTANVQTNKLGEALIIGFSQVAESDSVRKYFLRGKEITKKHIEVFNTYLNKNDLPAPSTWDHLVTESTVAPFSDKLMMFHIELLSATGMGNYGIAMSQSMRRDLTADYARLSIEIGKYAEDGANITIDNGWMERPPHAADRDELAKK